MADTDVNIPGIGTIPRWGIYVVAGGGAIVLIMLYRNHEKASAAAASAAANPPTAQTGTGADTGIDPATGYPYGSPEDQAALEQQSASSGSGAIDPTTGLPYGSPEDQAALAQMYSGESVVSGYGTGSVPSTGSTTGGIGTNAEWVQAALANLATLGYNEQTAATALATYLAQMPLNAQQAQMVQVAVAETGPPPVGTFQIIPTGGGTGGSGTGGGGGGTPPPATSKPGPVTDINPTKSGANSVTVTWRPPQFASTAPYATTYNFGISPSPAGGSSGVHNIGSRTSYNVSGIKPGTTYRITVSATNSAGTGDPATATYKAT